MTFTLLQINVAEPAAEAAKEVAAESGELTLSFWELAMKGGWIMVPIFILSIIAVYIFVERFFAIRNAMIVDTGLMEQVKADIKEGRIDEAVSKCEEKEGPIAHMLEKGLKRIGRPLTDINAAIENVGKQEVSKLEKGLPTLATASGGAPMIGFLGTVMGMIRAFYDMANAGNNIDVSLLSSGIYTAMVTTVAGLIVGIIAYFAYNFLVARIEKVVAMLEANITEFMDILNEPAK